MILLVYSFPRTLNNFLFKTPDFPPVIIILAQYDPKKCIYSTNISKITVLQ